MCSSNLRYNVTTSLHPCSIETFGTSGHFICGLYELIEEDSTQYRNGAIVLYDNKGTELQKIDYTSGVLDVKLNGSQSLLAAAMSSSQISISTINSEYTISKLYDIPLLDEGLILSVSWNNIHHINTTNSALACSSQCSTLTVVAIGQTGTDIVMKIENAHIFLGENVPAWVVAYDTHSDHKLASGGDDNKLKLWDIRSGSNIETNKNVHTAGVTAVLYLLFLISFLFHFFSFAALSLSHDCDSWFIMFNFMLRFNGIHQ